MTTLDYQAFLHSKVKLADGDGFPCDPSEVHPLLKDHQRAIVAWAVRGGRRAIFAAFGLGKSLMQLEILRIILGKLAAAGTEESKGLIVCPLGVRQEFMRDASMIGLSVRFIRRTEDATEPGIYLTNYESVRDGKLDPRAFDVVSLDEAAILRGFGSTKTFREFMRIYEGSSRYRFVATATPSPNEYLELLSYAAFLDIMDVGAGKAQPLDAKILTPSGWRRMGDISVGDFVIAADGSQTRVVGVYPQGDRPIYRITCSDGATTECDAEHLWFTKTQLERNAEHKYHARGGRARGYGKVRSTSEIADSLTYRGGRNHSLPLVAPVALAETSVSIDPWLLGYLLGNGTIRETSVTVSAPDAWTVDRISSVLPVGLSLRRIDPELHDYSITSTGKQGGHGPGSNPLLSSLRAYGLLGHRSWEKFAPRDYLFNGVDVRLALLRGLLDSDGTVAADGTCVSFTSASIELAEAVRFLVQSLGGTASIRVKTTPHRDAHEVGIVPPNGINVFLLPRKADRLAARLTCRAIRYIDRVEAVGTKAAQCIAIEHPSRLYVTDDFLVTHNTRFFKRDSTKADRLTLRPHQEKEFWLWVSSWAMFLQRPSDLGYSDDGYVLPPLDVRWHEVPSEIDPEGIRERNGQVAMWNDASLGVTHAAREKRRSLGARVAKMRALLDEDPDAHVLLWHDLEAERHEIARVVPTAAAVWGSQDLDARESLIAAFSNGGVQYLAAKPVMLGSGCNFQRHCHRAIFVGIGFKFSDFIQAVHRIHRFLQDRPVRIDLIYTEAERSIRADLERKWQQHEELVAKMGEIIRQFGLSRASMASSLTRQMGVERREITGDGWRYVNNDTVLETAAMPANSVDLIVTSIPFSTQYEYTPSYNDFGHSEDNAMFWRQMGFLSPHLLRVLRPGRVCAIHVKDRIAPGGLTGLGFQSVQPFHAEAIQHYMGHGFAYLGMITVVTDVVRENNQTYRLGWSEQCKDGSRMGVGMPEYVLLFRKPPTDASNGYADVPVVKDKNLYSLAQWQLDAHGFWRSSGNRLLTSADIEQLPHEAIYKRFREQSLATVYDFGEHVRLVQSLGRKLPVTFMLMPPHSWHPEVWSDVARMRTLNMEQERKGNELHLCCLQYDIVDRLVVKHSMPGETVYDPFGGLGTVVVRALKLKRQGIGVELNTRYFRDAVNYCHAAAADVATPSLFDLVPVADVEEVA